MAFAFWECAAIGSIMRRTSRRIQDNQSATFRSTTYPQCAQLNAANKLSTRSDNLMSADPGLIPLFRTRLKCWFLFGVS
jgi:hypothetical protein